MMARRHFGHHAAVFLVHRHLGMQGVREQACARRAAGLTAGLPGMVPPGSAGAGTTVMFSLHSLKHYSQPAGASALRLIGE